MERLEIDEFSVIWLRVERQKDKRRSRTLKRKGSHHEWRWVMSPWLGETISIRGILMGKYPGQHLENSNYQSQIK